MALWNQRYVGKEGAVFINAFDPSMGSGGGSGGGGSGANGVNRLAWTFNWSLEVQQETVACAAKTEPHDTFALGGVSTRVTAERFQSLASNGNVWDTPSATTAGIIAAAPLQPPAYTAAGSNLNDLTGATATVYLYGIDLGITTGKPAAGSFIKVVGFVIRSQIQNPRGASTEQFEMIGTTMPVVVDQSSLSF